MCLLLQAMSLRYANRQRLHGSFGPSPCNRVMCTLILFSHLFYWKVKTPICLKYNTRASVSNELQNFTYVDPNITVLNLLPTPLLVFLFFLLA